MDISSQVNLVVNPGFEEYNYFETELTSIPLYAATGWNSFRAADLYLREELDKNGNIIRLASYSNESVIGSLKYPTQKNTVYHFSLNVFSFKKRKQNNLFQLCFVKNMKEGLKDPYLFSRCLYIPSKKIRIGWQTLEFVFYAPEGMNNFILGNTKNLKDQFVIFIDNVKILAPVEEPVGTIQLETD